jgi:iron complex outermembrane receptor protein
MNDNLVLLTGLVAASLCATAYGQSQVASDATTDVASGAGLEEVIVTAKKRSERLQDVPLAVTAIGAEALSNREINDTNSLTRVAPSLSFQQGNNPTNSSFRIRGIGATLFGVGFEPSVSVVVDGVVMARSGQSFADLNDVERIEVLRGPQGTLFGKNSTAGVINVITERPDDVFAASWKRRLPKMTSTAFAAP